MEFDQHTLHRIFINYVYEIENQYHTYQKALDNPELIITDMFNPKEYQPFYNHMQDVLSSGGVQLHDFAKVLYERLKPFLYELDDEIELSATYSRTMLISIKYMGYTLLNFDIYAHVYTDESHWYGSNGLKGKLKSSLDFYNATAEKIKKYRKYYSSNSEIWKASKNETNDLKFLHRCYRRSKSLFVLMVRNKTINNNLNTIISDKEAILSDCTENIKITKQKIKELEEIQPTLNSKLKEWETRFANWGYKKWS